MSNEMSLGGQMREVKFRAWDDANDKMHHNFQFVKSGNESNDWILFVSDLQPISNYDGWHKNPYFQQQLKIMQFTGLKDSNGRDIYEGDVVRMFWQHDGCTNFDYEITGSVVYSLQMAQFIVENDAKVKWCPFYSFEREEYFPDETEVIGNIYQNPELLEGK